MKIRTAVATVIGGAAITGFTALAIGPAASAGAQQARPTVTAASVAPQQATTSQGCWDEDCYGNGGYYDEDWGYWGYWD